MAPEGRLTGSVATNLLLDGWEPEHLLDKVLGSVPHVVYVFNHEIGANELVNGAIADLTGYDPQEIADMGDQLMTQIIMPEDMPRIAKHFDRMKTLNEGEVATLSYRLVRKDGGLSTVQSHDVVFDRAPDRSVRRHLGIATDISPQMAESEITQSIRREADRANRLLSAVFDTVGSGIIGLDQDRRVLTINPTARHILGGIVEDLPFAWPSHIRFLEYGGLQEMIASSDPINRALAGADLDGEVHLLSRAQSAEARYVRVSSTFAQDDETGLRTVVVLDDVTELEKTRQQFERASRLDALGQLTGGIAHDFNNLIATTMYAVQMSLEAERNEAETYLSGALRSMERGKQLTHRLLAFDQKQPGLSGVKPVRDLFEQFDGLVRPTLEAKITLEYSEEIEGLCVFCDSAQLENALLDLVLNARDAILASGRGDRILIEARRAADLDDDPAQSPGSTSDASATGKLDGFIEIAVTDNGPGMEDEVKRRATDPFFTTRNNKTSSSGLGLSMVYGFLQQSGGDLRIYSEVGHGTTIRMIIPAGSLDPMERMDNKPEPIIRGNGEKILLVEDEADLRRMMEKLLIDMGYEVAAARSGAEAARLIASGLQVDLLLTDVVMPGGIGGFELARIIRTEHPGIPVVYMSGYTGFSEDEMGGVVAPMVRKPSAPQAVSAVLAKALGREAP